MTAAPTIPMPDDTVEAYRSRIEGHDLVLYDGVCGLCNGVVQYLLRHDQADRFRFIPQETSLSEDLLRRFPTEPHPAEGVILITAALTPAEHIYRRSDALGQARLEGPASALAALFRRIPRTLRESLYRLIARHRYRIFGRYTTCPIPTPEQRNRILGLPT